MSTNSQYGRTETPINLLEPIEIDFMAGQPFDPAKYGRTETPINLLEPIEIDFAVPKLILTLRLSDTTGLENVDHLALDVLNLLDALSAYEKAIGGRGLRLHDRSADTGSITMTLVPILLGKASDRVDHLAELLSKLASRPKKMQDTETPLLEAIAKLEGSPAEQCIVAFARRQWSIEAHVARAA